MYISYYLIPPQEIRELKIKDTYSYHRVVYALFDDIRGDKNNSSSGILYTEKSRDFNGIRLLIFSDRYPRHPEHGILERVFELPESFFQFPMYRFAITVNPIKVKSHSHHREPVFGPEKIANWFSALALRKGFSLQDNAFQVDDIFVDSFKKGKDTVTIQKAKISGILTVTDKELFRNSVYSGIGHAKAFGCGLLQIACINN